MRDEGSAGFASGPWDEADMEGDNELSARQRQQRRWGLNAARQRRQRTVGDIILTWAAILALITLTAGIAGAWLSYQPEPGVTVTRTGLLNKPPGLDRVESRLTRMEKRLSHILDPYIRTLTKLSGTQKQLTGQINNIEKKQNTAATGFDERLEVIEQRMQIADERLDALSATVVALADGKVESLTGGEQPAPLATAQVNTHEQRANPTAEIPDSTPVAIPAPAEPGPTVPATQKPVTGTLVDRQPDAASELATTVDEPAPASEPGQGIASLTLAPPPITGAPAPGPVAAVAATVMAPQGNWVINIASYTNEHIARRKLAQMQQQGVDAELVPAEVNGRTIYRARVFGFASRRAAGSAATEIKSRLGIAEVWITKLQNL